MEPLHDGERNENILQLTSQSPHALIPVSGWSPPQLFHPRHSAQPTLDSLPYHTHLWSFVNPAFSVVVPTLWNSLPGEIRLAPSLESFKHHLKTHLFKLACNPLTYSFLDIVLFFFTGFPFFDWWRVWFFSVKWPWASWKALYKSKLFLMLCWKLCSESWQIPTAHSLLNNQINKFALKWEKKHLLIYWAILEDRAW